MKDVVLLLVFAIDPPGEVEQQFLEDALQEEGIALPRALLLLLVDMPRGPGMHGRIDVAEGPFVGGQLAVGMHVPLVEQQE